MNKPAFIITSLAGISTILGFFILWIQKQDNVIAKSLGFSSGVLVFVSIFDLLPNSLFYFKKAFIPGFHLLFCILFFLMGILLSTILNENIHNRIGDNNSLYQIGILSMLAIILHNIPEGIITYLTTTVEYNTGILLAFSIACHNIPEGICIAIPIYYATNNKWKAFKMILLSALSEPLGACIAAFFFKENLSDMMIAIFLSLVSGIMISLALLEILPEAKKYSLKYTILYSLLGFIVMLISHLLF